MEIHVSHDQLDSRKLSLEPAQVLFYNALREKDPVEIPNLSMDIQKKNYKDIMTEIADIDFTLNFYADLKEYKKSKGCGFCGFLKFAAERFGCW